MVTALFIQVISYEKSFMSVKFTVVFFLIHLHTIIFLDNNFHRVEKLVRTVGTVCVIGKA